MKKLIILGILAMFLTPSIHAQYDIGSQGAAYLNGGKLGIGTTSPSRDIHISRSAGAASFLVERASGKWIMGIAGMGGAGFYFKNDGRLTFSPSPNTSVTNADIANSMFLYGSQTNFPGQMCLGTATPGDNSKLTVAGRIRSEEVQVVNDVEAPDYVFASDYQLRSLDEVEAFIQKNKHLPEIPSAAEFCDNGVMLGEMSFDLLKKVEELTLYIIDLNKKIESLESQLKK